LDGICSRERERDKQEREKVKLSFVHVMKAYGEEAVQLY
jgi:hypothetical protein